MKVIASPNPEVREPFQLADSNNADRLSSRRAVTYSASAMPPWVGHNAGN